MIHDPRLDELRQESILAKKFYMVAFVLAAILTPFFYHFLSIALLPLLVPLVIIFFFVYFTGLTDFEKRKVTILNIVLSLVAIALYEGYLVLFALPSGHNDLHLNMAIWLVQLISLNFFLLLYLSIVGYRKRKALQFERQ